jgi:hypothetical protein
LPAQLGGGDQSGSAGTHDQRVEQFGLGHAAQLWHNTCPQ